MTVIMAKREHEKSRKKEVRKAGGGRVGGRKEEKKVKEMLIADEDAGRVEPLELELSHFARRNAN